VSEGTGASPSGQQQKGPPDGSADASVSVSLREGFEQATHLAREADRGDLLRGS